MEKYQKIIYVAGPVTSPDGILNEQYENIHKARQVAVELWKEGYTVFCPHMNSMFMDGIIPHDDWYKRDLVILERCDAVVLCEGWQDSRGSKIERARAEELGIPVAETTFAGWKECLAMALRDRERG